MKCEEISFSSDNDDTIPLENLVDGVGAPNLVLDTLREELERVRQECVDKDAALVAAKHEIIEKDTALEDARDEFENDGSVLKARIEELKNICDGKENKFTEVMTQLQEMKDASTKIMQTLEQTRANLSEQTKQLVQKISKIDTLQSACAEKDAALVDAEARIATLEAEMIASKVSIDEALMQRDNFEASQADLIVEMNKIMDTKLEAEALVHSLQVDNDLINKNLSSCMEKCNFLETENLVKDDAIAEVENELFQLKRDTETDNSSSTQSVKANGDSNASELIDLKEKLIAKEERIVHLEKSKLTKDQIEKIKQVKVEKSRLVSENKDLKKDVQSLEGRLSMFKEAARASRAEIAKLKEEIATAHKADSSTNTTTGITCISADCDADPKSGESDPIELHGANENRTYVANVEVSPLEKSSSEKVNESGFSKEMYQNANTPTRAEMDRECTQQ